MNLISKSLINGLVLEVIPAIISLMGIPGTVYCFPQSLPIESQPCREA